MNCEEHLVQAFADHQFSGVIRPYVHNHDLSVSDIEMWREEGSLNTNNPTNNRPTFNRQTVVTME